MQPLKPRGQTWTCSELKTSFAGGKRLIKQVLKDLRPILRGGNEAEKFVAAQLELSAELELAKLNWQEGNNITDIRQREALIVDASECLKHLIDNGNPDQKSEATQLLASFDMKSAELKWEEFHIKAEPSVQKAFLHDALTLLQNSIRNGNQDEKQKATQLKATMNLEIARLYLEESYTKTTPSGKEAVLYDASMCLENVLQNGTPEEKQRAKELKAVILSEAKKYSFEIKIT